MKLWCGQSRFGSDVNAGLRGELIKEIICHVLCLIWSWPNISIKIQIQISACELTTSICAQRVGSVC